MPITRTAIIDDDGTGTTGTVLDNAWKQELYGQIDAVVIPSPLIPASIVKANGSTTAPGAFNMSTTPTLAVGTVGLYDTIICEVEIFYVGAPFLPLAITYVSGATITTLVRLDLLGGPVGNGAGAVWRVALRGWGTDAAIFLLSHGGSAAGAVVQALLISAGIPGWTNAPWSLVLQHGGVPAGGTLIWKWSVTQQRQ